MEERFVDIYCGTLAGTRRTQPFGPETVFWTVDGRMFAAYTHDGNGVSVRLADKVSAHRLIGQRRALAPSYLKNDGWLMFPWDTRPEELRDRINESYRLVRQDGNVSA